MKTHFCLNLCLITFGMTIAQLAMGDPITFEGLERGRAFELDAYTENGFLVTPKTGRWWELTDDSPTPGVYGNPGPSIWADTYTSVVEVTNTNGDSFTFSGADVWQDDGGFAVEGFLNGMSVFSDAGTGSYNTWINTGSPSSAEIDSLLLSFTAGVYLDNIDVTVPTSSPSTISVEDVKHNWTQTGAPISPESNNPITTWTVIDGGIETSNGTGSLVSDFTTEGDFEFSVRVRPISKEFADNDLWGVAFGLQDMENHYRVGWSGGGFLDGSEGGTGADGLYMARETDGVGTLLFNDDSIRWRNDVDYDVSVSRSGDDIGFSVVRVSDGITIGSATVTDTTFTQGHVGVWIASQSTRFSDFSINFNSPVVVGDFNSDGLLTVDDLNQLSDAIWEQTTDAIYDVSGDGDVDTYDRVFWITEIKGTVFGDANLDGKFDSTDLIEVLQAGEFIDGIPENSSWAEGDFGGDREFDTDDLILALQTGAYEMGPVATVRAVPEPTGFVTVFVGLVGLCYRRHPQRTRRVSEHGN